MIQEIKEYIFIFLLIIIYVLIFHNTIFASAPYNSYTYNFWGTPISSPAPYVFKEVISAQDLDIDRLKDIYINNDGNIFLLDSGNNSVIILKQDKTIKTIISYFNNGEKIDTFNNPSGIFVTSKGYLYVADTDNNRIVVLDEDMIFLKEVEYYEEDEKKHLGILFEPTNLVVDNAGRIYVIAKNVLEGLMVFDINNVFQGFIGAPRVSPNFWDYFWRRIATDRQRERLALFVPTQYSGIDISKEGFIYTTNNVQINQAIKKMSPSGRDLLVRRGFHPLVGDIQRGWSNVPYVGYSSFVDITIHDNGIYSVLDAKRGRIFTYNNEGHLLFVFGSLGHRKGNLIRPIAIENYRDELYVLDERLNKVIVYKQTDYASSIFSAIDYNNNGFYTRANQMWQNVLKYNSNYDLAYTGIGNSLFRKNKFEDAMIYFKAGNNRQKYSNAFNYYRKKLIEKNFGDIMLSITFFISIIFVLGKQHKKKKKIYKELGDGNNISDHIKYSLYVIFHPLDGFWDLKHEKRGSVFYSFVLLFLFLLSYIMREHYSGFIFNLRNVNEINIYIEMITLLIPFFLWCGVNWGFTTLMDGKGTIKEVFIASAYSLIPIIVLWPPLTLLSNYLTLEEGTFYYGLMVLSLCWFLFLLFFGTMVTHEYTVTKTIVSIIFIFLGIGFTLFISLLGFSLINTLIEFIKDIYIEILY